MAISIREIDHIVLRVKDLDRMLDFYCDVLGCTVERRVDDLGLIQLRAGRSLVDLVPVDSELGRGTRVVVNLPSTGKSQGEQCSS